MTFAFECLGRRLSAVSVKIRIWNWHLDCIGTSAIVNTALYLLFPLDFISGYQSNKQNATTYTFLYFIYFLFKKAKTMHPFTSTFYLSSTLCPSNT